MLEISKETQHALVSKLNALALGLDLNQVDGICQQLQRVVQSRYSLTGLNWSAKKLEWTEVRSWLVRQYPSWPLYSGDALFPVPAPQGFEGSRYSTLSLAGQAFGPTPRWEGEYGAARKYLASHLMYHLENELCIPSKT